MNGTNKNIDSSKNEPSQHSEAPQPEGFGEAAGLFAPLPAGFLLERGYCCGNGCQNCPYDYKAVAEPRRSQLLAKRNNNNSNNNAC